jgi:hypothetical protein
MSSNPCLAAAIKELATAGIHHPEIAHGGKHTQRLAIHREHPARSASDPAQ